MVKRMLMTAMLLGGMAAAPRPAIAGCTTDLADCYAAAAKIEIGRASCRERV